MVFSAANGGLPVALRPLDEQVPSYFGSPVLRTFADYYTAHSEPVSASKRAHQSKRNGVEQEQNAHSRR